MERLSNLATLASQFLNVLICNGQPDETLSGRAYREGVLLRNERWARVERVLNALFFDAHHCRTSHLRDVEFAKLILQVPRE